MLIIHICFIPLKRNFQKIHDIGSSDGTSSYELIKNLKFDEYILMDKYLYLYLFQNENKIYLFDTTLRDGQQTTGVNFSVSDKVTIANALNDLGIDYIEGGWPGANPTDNQFFERGLKFRNSLLTAFGMTRRPNHSAANDPGLNSLLNSAAKAVCIVGKSSLFQVKEALNISQDENLEMIKDSIIEIVKKNKESILN